MGKIEPEPVYIDEPTLTPGDAKCHAREIGAGLHILHASPKNPHLGDAKYLDEAEYRYRFLQDRIDPKQSSQQISFLLNDAAKAIEFIRDNAPHLASGQVNIHGDLHPQNLFWTHDGLKMIDWESTVWDNPYLDLGRLSTSLALDDDADMQLLEGYFGRIATQEEERQFLLSKKLNYAHHALIGFKIVLCILEQEPQPLDFISGAPSWSACLDSFSRASERMPLQFFYDYARCALEMCLKPERIICEAETTTSELRFFR